MVARGDLGIETDLADLPIFKEEYVFNCKTWQRSIVATHLLESMIEIHTHESRILM